VSYGLLFALLVVGAQIAGAILKRRAEREEELKRQQRRGTTGSPLPMPPIDDGTGTSDFGTSSRGTEFAARRDSPSAGAGVAEGSGGSDQRLAQGMSVLPSEKRLDRHVLDAAGSRGDALTGPPGSIQPRAATRDPFLDPAFGRDAARMAGSPGAPVGGRQSPRTMAPMRGSTAGAQQPTPGQPRPSLRTPPSRPPAPPPPMAAGATIPTGTAGQKGAARGATKTNAAGSSSKGSRPSDTLAAARAPRPDRAPSAEHAFVSSIAPIAASAITSASTAARAGFRGAASSSRELRGLLHNRAELRRAMILREVLGPALATRDPLMLPIDR
jgi:hypothetical protein